MNLTNHLNLTNHFLVAMPSFMNGNIFTASVVYITEHSSINGAVGVIVNKPLSQTLKNAFQDLDIELYNPNWVNYNLYLGGPMGNKHGYVLHRTVNSDGKLFDLTNNRNILVEIAASEFKNDLFVSVGYAVWNTFQIESEIKANNWLVLKVDHELIFSAEPINRYDVAMKMLGIDNVSRLYCCGDTFA